MCDISIPTELKSKTVYKVVYLLDNGDLISPFAHATITEGRMENLPDAYKRSDNYYNLNMVGRVSGFENPHDAVKLMHCMYDSEIASSKYVLVRSPKKILAVELESTPDMPIMEGTVMHVASEVDENPKNKTFAGPLVRSIRMLPDEEILKWQDI